MNIPEWRATSFMPEKFTAGMHRAEMWSELRADHSRSRRRFAGGTKPAGGTAAPWTPAAHRPRAAPRRPAGGCATGRPRPATWTRRRRGSSRPSTPTPPSAPRALRASARRRSASGRRRRPRTASRPPAPARPAGSGPSVMSESNWAAGAEALDVLGAGTRARRRAPAAARPAAGRRAALPAARSGRDAAPRRRARARTRVRHPTVRERDVAAGDAARADLAQRRAVRAARRTRRRAPLEPRAPRTTARAGPAREAPRRAARPLRRRNRRRGPRARAVEQLQPRAAGAAGAGRAKWLGEGHVWGMVCARAHDVNSPLG